MGKLYYRLEENCPIDEVGGKSGMLSVLEHFKAPIPSGIALGAELEKEFLLSAGMTDNDIQRALNCEVQYGEIMRDKISNAKWSDDMIAKLKEIYELISEGPICVRSSALNEDGRTNSFAGIFRSNINVRTFGEFLYAIRDCWMSGIEDNAVSYARKVGTSLTLMAETVQIMIYAVSAGVATIENGVITISAALGQGVGVVSGRIECDTYKIQKDMTLISENVVKKESAFLANMRKYPVCFREIEYPWLNGAIKRFYVDSDDERSALLKGKFIENQEEKMKPVLDEKKRRELAELCFQVAEKLAENVNWDFEWCMDAEGKLYLTQLRPLLSTMQDAKKAVMHTKKVVAGGIPISIGSNSGRCVIVYSSEDYGKVKQGDVVYLNVVMDTFVQILSKVNALILGPEASSLSHCAIIAREWEVPCVGGIDRNSLKEYEIYEVDGTSGIIYEANKSANDKGNSKKKTDSNNEITEIPLLPYLLTAFENVASGAMSVEKEIAVWQKSIRLYPHLIRINCEGVALIKYQSKELMYLFEELKGEMLSSLPVHILVI